jgi:uncharacterized tellurite resistance protein B-like protein
MEITRLTSEQREALIDLLILAMYADGYLDLVEDARLQRLLIAMGFEAEYDRQRKLDETFTRLREYSQNAELARKRAVQLASHFMSVEQRRGVFQLLEQQISSDNKVVPAEHQLLSAIREVFQM